MQAEVGEEKAAGEAYKHLLGCIGFIYPIRSKDGWYDQFDGNNRSMTDLISAPHFVTKSAQLQKQTKFSANSAQQS